MRKRRAQADRWVGAVLAVMLFGAFPAFIIVGTQTCTGDKSGVFCSAVKFLFDDAPWGTQVAKAKLAQ
jgi:hypothetical protein